MRDFDTLTFHPLAESIVDILCKKTQNDNPNFFRILVSYYLGKIAASMRVKIATQDRGEIPVNVYALNLAPSGFSKDFSSNIMEEDLLAPFRSVFYADTYPIVSEEAIYKLAAERAMIDDIEEEESLSLVQKEFKELGELAFSFDSGTPAAIKQMRHKLLMSNIGSVNLEINECYTPDIEILTEKGFIRFDELPKNLKVAQFNTHTDKISFTKPSKYTQKQYDGTMYDLVTPTGFDMSVTENHEVLTWRKGEYFKCKPNELNTGFYIPITGKLEHDYSKNNFNVTTALSIAIQADGSIRKSGVEFGFKKQRKIDRLKEILDFLCIPYGSWEGSQGHTCFYLSNKVLTNIIVTKNLRKLIPSLDKIDRSFCQDFIAETIQWDGHINKNLPNIWSYINTNKKSANAIHELAVLCGYNSLIRNRPKKGYGACYYVSMNTTGVDKAQLAHLNKPSGKQKPIRTTRRYSGEVFCVTVPTGCIVLRRNGKSFIGGNCGSNIVGNSDALNTFLELYDVGKIKQKLTKNTKENTRSKEIDGRTPTNLMMYGTPDKLFDGGKVEEEFYSFLETGYGRRFFFGYAKLSNKNTALTPEEIFDILTDPSVNQDIKDIAIKFSKLASIVNHNKVISVDRKVSILVIAYRLYCEERANQMKEHQGIARAEMSHRYFKTLKLAGAYAFVDGDSEITEDNYYHAIRMAEESGKAFDQIMSRDGIYVKLAKYIGSIGRELTHVELQEALPFYRGSNTAKADLIQLASAWGYKNHTLIKRTITQGIEFFSGEQLQETNLEALSLSYSHDIADGYTNVLVKWEDLNNLTQEPYTHWINHYSTNGHRSEEHIVPGFDLLVLDVDGTDSIDTCAALLKDYKFLAHTTKRHTDDVHRFRLILPMNYKLKLNQADYRLFMSNIYDWLPIEVDTQTAQRSRKWLTNKGEYFYNDGNKLLDARLFIPKTSKNDEHIKFVATYQSMTNMERWFLSNSVNGSRNNQLLKYALMMVDLDYDLATIENNVLEMNSKLTDGLSIKEIKATIIVSAARKIGKRNR